MNSVCSDLMTMMGTRVYTGQQHTRRMYSSAGVCGALPFSGSSLAVETGALPEFNSRHGSLSDVIVHQPSTDGQYWLNALR